MGIHLPLSIKCQAEARTLLLSINNLQSPANGQTNVCPSQEIVLGCYYLTSENSNLYYLFKKIIRKIKHFTLILIKKFFNLNKILN